MPPARLRLKQLEEPYRSRALTPGTARYLSWLFAAPTARDPLLGIFALLAEWRALMDPATEVSVAHLKFAWWADEMHRLRERSPAHPISRFLHELPNAPNTDFAPLGNAVEAALECVAGAPLERACDLERFAQALIGAPLGLATSLGGSAEAAAVCACTTAIASGEYLARAAIDYRRDARRGRVCLPVDELLSAGIENADLLAEQPSPRLIEYLRGLRLQATSQFAAAVGALPTALRSSERHLLVLAQAEQRLVSSDQNGGARRHMQNLYAAWAAARRAAKGR